MAKTFPLDAKIIAFKIGMSFLRAATNATSDENGKIVAAKKAERNRPSSAI